MGIFGSCPIALLQDHEVKPNAVKVFIAIASFEGTNDSSFPSREKIAERSGLSTPEKVSNAIQNLVECGWLEVIRRGKKQTNIYRCVLKSEMPESGTVPESDMPESGTSDVPKTGTGDMPESGTSIVKEQLKDHLKEQYIAPAIAEAQEKTQAVTIPTKEQSLHHRLIDFFCKTYKSDTGSDLAIDGKEAKAVKEIIKRAHGDDKAISQKLKWFRAYMQYPTNEFWASMQFTPTKVLSRWNDLTAPRDIVDKTSMKQAARLERTRQHCDELDREKENQVDKEAEKKRQLLEMMDL